jgi:uncharacterized protein (TIGR03086 family)
MTDETTIEIDAKVPLVRIIREFDAPPTLVYRAHTDPELLRQWEGPDGTVMHVETHDCRRGGAYRYLHTTSNGFEAWFRGCFHEVREPDLIVRTFTYEGYPDGVALERLVIEDLGDGRSRLVATSLVESFEDRDAFVASGMEHGVREGYAKLDRLLASTDTASSRFRRVAATFTDRIGAVESSAWTNPAPCEGWTARDVVRHLVAWVPDVIGRSGIEIPQGPSVDDDPLGAWTTLADALQAALDDPATAARTFDVGPPGEMTIESAIDQLVTGDVLVHTWDLARAVGLDERIDAGIAASMYEGMLPIDAVLRSSGHFGPRVDVSDDADIQTKLLAFTGRRV